LANVITYDIILAMDITANTIKELRKTLNLSQEDFAALLGTTTHTIHRWEAGKHKPSRMAKVLLARVLADKENHNG